MQIRNIEQLRDSLLGNYEKMKEKKMPLSMGKELSNVAGKVISSVSVQVQYMALTKSPEKIPFLETPKA